MGFDFSVFRLNNFTKQEHMRKDIRHVVVERPRTGGRYSKVGRSRFDWPDKGRDPPPNKEPMRLRHHLSGWPKQFSDYLAPLERFLYKNVGRPWDNVYSEICKNLRMESTQQRHVRTHIYDYVYLHVRIREDGAVCLPAHRSFFQSGLYPLKKGKLYVCPRTGILKKVRRDW